MTSEFILHICEKKEKEQKCNLLLGKEEMDSQIFSDGILTSTDCWFEEEM